MNNRVAAAVAAFWVGAAGLVVADHAQATPPATSVAALMSRIPDLPDTAEAAASWVDRSGRLVHAGLLALRADIAAHQQAVAQIRRAVAEQHHAQSALVTENLGKGMADVGIDMARMQTDPAYAQQVQERVKKMSPQELMLMSQKMAQPLNHDARYQNAAKAMVDDAPAAQAAAAAGEAYSQGVLARLKAQQALWQQADEAVARVSKKPLAVPAKKPAMEWENIGCDAGCRAQWDVHAAQMLPLMMARGTEALRIRRATLHKHRAAVADGLAAADKHLLATRYGALSKSQVNQGRIVDYDAAAIGELLQLIERIADSVKSAAGVVHCGTQTVLAPNAVCR